MYGNQNMQQGMAQPQQGQEEREYGWEDTIVNDSEFILIPPGIYDFTVTGFDRGRFAGSTKMPACNKANLNIEIKALVDGQVKTVTIQHGLLLHSKVEGLLSAFFTCIGQKKKGQPLQMNWNQVPGSTGKCEIFNDEYNGNKYNKIKKFLPPVENTAPVATQGFPQTPQTF